MSFRPFRATLALAAVLALNAPAAWTAPVSSLSVSPPARCLPPRRPPDATIPPPALVSSFPAPGAVVRPGLLVVRLTFSVAMSCDGIFQPVAGLPKPCGGTLQKIVVSFDRLTIRMACIVAPSVHYGLRFNYPPTAGDDAAASGASTWFASLAGQPADATLLTFSTLAGPEVTTLEEAEAEDAASGS